MVVDIGFQTEDAVVTVVETLLMESGLAPTPYAVERYVRALNRAIATAQLSRGAETFVIPVQPSHEMIVDEADAWLGDYAWHSHVSGRNRYACVSFGAGLHVPAHAILVRTFPRGGGIDVDHVDGDSLNNRRANLRYAMHGENVARGFEARRGRLREEARERADLAEIAVLHETRGF